MTWAQIYELYTLNDGVPARNTEARYNIAPTQDVLFCRLERGGDRTIEQGRWGFVPHWAKEIPKAPMFNARSESVAGKPAFRDAFRMRRCLIPADGFYEWVAAEDGEKDPWFMHLPNDRPFSFAGLWAHNDNLGVTSCTILTAAAAGPVRRVHDRMPVILNPSAYDEWLDPSTTPVAAQSILARNLDGDLLMHRVGRQVNSSRYQGNDAPRAI